MKKRFANKIYLGLSMLVLCGAFSAPKTFADKTPVEAKSSEKTVPAWVLNVNSNFAGTVLYYITPDAVRMKFDKLGLLMLIKAPKWNALVYNDSNKNYVDLPYDHWKAKFLLRGKKVADKAVVMTPLKTGKMQTIQGVKCYQVIVKKKDPKSKQTEIVAETWIAKDIKTPPQFNSMMKTMLDIPVDVGTPLRVLQMAKTSNKMTVVMDCYKANKVDVKVSEFMPLKGYKKVKDEMAMMLDEGDEPAAGAEDPLDAMPTPVVKPVTPLVPKKTGSFFDMFHK